jgi:tetratricopeptide (TPR) repeat protein/tRNA A-37 threonylcarbamoyl transferase component Bud32
MSSATDGSTPDGLHDLVLRWESLHAAGHDLPAEHLCADRPELAQELRQWIAKLQAMEPVLDSSSARASAGASSGEGGSTACYVPTPTPPAASVPGQRETARSQVIYDDLRFHDAGGLGEVFVARDAGLNREVALKFIKARRAADPTARRRFLLEAEVTGRLEHPGIVPVYGLGQDASGQPCYAMRLIRGETLQDAIDRFHAADVPDRDRSERAVALRGLLRRFVAVCNTIAYAHSQGVLHRDLKPRNILLDQYDVTLVVDWGLAKLLDRDEVGATPGADLLAPRSSIDAGPGAATATLVGTPHFMSPEQAEGRPLGPASDIYSLGATLYTLLTGRTPFRGQRKVRLSCIRGKFPAPRRVKPAVPRGLEAVCLKAMALRPEARYATVLDLAADLERWLAGEPVAAWREPLWTRAIRLARRHKPAVVGSIVAVAVASLAAFAMWVVNDRRIATLQHEVQAMVLRGQAAASIQDYPDAKLVLSSAVAKIGSERTLAGLKADAERLLDEIERYEKFLAQRDDALFRGTLATSLGLPDNVQATEDACRRALRLFGVDADGVVDVAVDSNARAAGALAPRLLEGRKEITVGCYELLILLAEAVASRGSGTDRAASDSSLRRALGILDRAARLAPPTQAYHLRRADLLARLGDERGAQEQRDRAAALRPTLAVDAFLVGDQHVRKGEIDQAIAHFDEALRLQPDHFWAQYFLAVCFLRTHRTQEAKAHLTASLGRRPDFLWLYVHRGFAQAELGAFDAAEDDFARALASQPGVEARYSVHVIRGAERIRHGRFAAAVADLEAATALLPDQCEAYVNLAQAYRSQGRLDAAVEQLSKAIRLRPQSALAYRNRASLFLERGDRVAALRDFEQALRLEPRDSPFQAQVEIERGRILEGQGYGPEAIAACDAALRASPDDPAALLLRAHVLLRLERFEEARQVCDRYLQRWGEPPAALFQIRGAARKRLRDEAAAAEDYTRALELAPSAEMHIHRGWAYIACAAWKLALRDFEAAIRLGPPLSDAYNGRAYARTQLGRYREGVTDAEEALRLQPQSPEMMYNVGCTFALAAGQAEADGALPDRRDLADLHRQRALAAIARALDMFPAERRPGFWHETIRTDVDLESLRGSSGYEQLKAKLPAPER